MRLRQAASICFLRVEAPGIEPGSESPQLQFTTCVVGACYPAGVSTDKPDDRDPGRSRPSLPGQGEEPACFMALDPDTTGGVPGERRVKAGLGGQREVNVVVGFCVFCRGFDAVPTTRGTRSEVLLPSSKPVRPQSWGPLGRGLPAPTSTVRGPTGAVKQPGRRLTTPAGLKA